MRPETGYANKPYVPTAARRARTVGMMLPGGTAVRSTKYENPRGSRRFDRAGKVVRVRSVWRVQDTYLVTSAAGLYGWPAADAKGRIVYRVPAEPAPPKVAPPRGVPYLPPPPESAFVVVVDVETRKLDTLGSIRIPKQVMTIRKDAEGRVTQAESVNPLPVTDDWAVLADGRRWLRSWAGLSDRLSASGRELDIVREDPVRLAAALRLR